MRFGETPVPIPNTMVKTKAADGTALETVWESRWLPAPFLKCREHFLRIKQASIEACQPIPAGKCCLAGFTSDQRLKLREHQCVRFCFLMTDKISVNTYLENRIQILIYIQT